MCAMAAGDSGRNAFEGFVLALCCVCRIVGVEVYSGLPITRFRYAITCVYMYFVEVLRFS